jgi:hypothetical protein
LSVSVILPNALEFATSPSEMAATAANTFPVNARVPGTEGSGFGLLEWYQAFVDSITVGESEARLTLPTPTHLIVRATDEFQAMIPWSQLATALIQFEMNGQPLAKGYPIRLYVPDVTSACLNVKSVVQLRFLADATLGDDAEYGFRNEISPTQLTKGLRTR